MFEQSLLLDQAPAKKAGAVAASLAMQTAIAGTLLLLPLLYTQRLVFMPPNLPVILPLTPPRAEPPPEVQHTTQVVHVQRGTPFFAPRNVPPLDPGLIVIDDPGLPPAPPGATDPIGLAANPAFPPIHVAPPPPVPIAPGPAPSKPVRVASEIQAAKLIRKVIPMYPRLAVLARVSGTVKLIGTVGTDGRIQQLQVISGPAMLVQAAVDAVRQWVYSPTLLNSTPVEVIAPIDVNFTLAQ